MDWKPEEEDLIRRYLLDDASAEERRQVEARLLEHDYYGQLLTLIEDELIDDYARGALPAGERELFARNFLLTARRRQDLIVVKEIMKHSAAGSEPEPSRRERQKPAPQWLRASFIPGWKLAVYAALALALGLTLWWQRRGDSEVERGLAALRQVYRGERTIEARLAGFDHAPFQVTRAPNDQEKDADYRAMDEAEVLLFRAARTQPNAQAWHALGQLYLVKREYEKAVDQLRQAMKEDSNNARLRSDLAAALLEQARLRSNQAEPGRGPELLAESLEHLNYALKLDPKLLEALFNRALVYEYLSQTQEAIADWRLYIDRDPTSPWSDEAKNRLKALSDRPQKISQIKEKLFDEFVNAAQAGDEQRAWQAFSNSRVRAGNLITEKLLERWTETAPQQQQQEARSLLQLLEYAGQIERLRADDHFTAELTEFYRKASDRRRRIIAARQSIKAARAEFDRSRFESAARLFDDAADRFLEAGNIPEATLARCWHGHSLLRIPKLNESLAVYREVEVISSQRRYRWLRSQTLNGIADNKSSRSEFSLALSYAKQSREIAEQIGDRAVTLRNLQLAMSMKLRFGRHLEALGYAEQFFTLTRAGSFEPRQLWPFYFENALNFLQLGYSAAAYASLQEALRLAKEANWPLIICRSYTRLGLFYETAQNYAEALRCLEMALAEGQKLAPVEGKINLTSYVWLQMGHSLLKSGAPQQAEPRFAQAIDEFSRLNLPYELFRARKGRLQTLIGLGRYDEAKLELDQALKLYEAHRQTINEEADRNSFFDREQDIYDTAISFAYGVRRDPQQAFQYAEASRSRALLDLRRERMRSAQDGGGPSLSVKALTEPLSLSEIRRRMPADTQLVEYAALPDRLIIWVVSHQVFHYAEQKIGADELRQEVERFRQLVGRPPTANAPDYRPMARRLYEVLIAPVEAMLQRQKLLCLAPDGPLYELPFAALLAPDAGAHLIDEYPLTLAPGASLLVLCAESGARRAVGPERLLAIGNPAFDRSKYPGLPNLSDAEKEAAEIAAFYPQASALTPRQATKARVISEMSRAGVIHLAAHSEVDQRYPMRTKIILAFDEKAARSGDEDSDSLQASEIYRIKLARAQLVVLSACSTGSGQIARGEGAITLARAFIAAGAPAVVASLWKVDSAATSDLMIDLHRRRTVGAMAASAALNKSQQWLRENGLPHPYYWASFVSFGV